MTSAGIEMEETWEPVRKSEWRTRSNRDADRMDGQTSGNEWVPAGKGGRQHTHYGPPPCRVIRERASPSLVMQGWVDDKPCLLSIDTAVYMTVAKPDIASGWPERQSNQHYMLQQYLGKPFPCREKFS
jgi:hypothetical protein